MLTYTYLCSSDNKTI